MSVLITCLALGVYNLRFYVRSSYSLRPLPPSLLFFSGQFLSWVVPFSLAMLITGHSGMHLLS